MKYLIGKIAVVTGGNSGIGYEIAKKLKEDGAKVIITGRSPNKVKQAAAEIGATGIVADVLDLTAISQAVIQVKKEFGKIDILAANAGTLGPTPIGRISEEVFDNQMDINFKGAVFTIEKFLPILNDEASIISISGVIGKKGMPNTAITSASKAALSSYTRSAAFELAHRKIRVNAVSPGIIHTPIFKKTGRSEESLGDFGQTVLNNIPLQRFGTPKDIAEVVAFLASDRASFISGSEYNVDGGISINPLVVPLENQICKI